MSGIRRVPVGYWFRFGLVMMACWMIAVSSYAIEAQPAVEQIQSILERGKASARQRLSPDQLHTSFGSKENLAPRGFIMTKLGSLLVMANHLALRDLSPTEQDIAQVMANDLLLVNVVIYGDRVNFAADSYVVMEQAGRTVKPASVRFDARGDRTPSGLTAGLSGQSHRAVSLCGSRSAGTDHPHGLSFQRRTGQLRS